MKSQCSKISRALAHCLIQIYPLLRSCLYHLVQLIKHQTNFEAKSPIFSNQKIQYFLEENWTTLKNFIPNRFISLSYDVSGLASHPNNQPLQYYWRVELDRWLCGMAEESFTIATSSAPLERDQSSCCRSPTPAAASSLLAGSASSHWCSCFDHTPSKLSSY